MTTLNYHELDSHSFMKWLILSVMTLSDDADAFLAATDGGKNVDFSLTISGIEVEPIAFFERMKRNMQHYAEQYAVEKVRDACPNVDELQDIVDDVTKKLKHEMRSRLSAIGIEIEFDEWGR